MNRDNEQLISSENAPSPVFNNGRGVELQEHELFPGTNGLIFNGLEAGRAYVKKLPNTGIWLEDWRMENPAMLTNFGLSNELQIVWMNSKDDSYVYKPTVPGASVYKAIMDYVYEALPKQSVVDAMDAPPNGATVMDFVIDGRETAPTTTNDPVKETAWMMRQTHTNTQSGVTEYTEFWALSPDYSAPSSNYYSITLRRVDAFKNKKPSDFLTAMNTQAVGQPGWLYVTVTYTVDKV